MSPLMAIILCATGSRSAVNTWKPEGDQQQDLKATFMLRALRFGDGSYNLTPKRSYSSQTQLCTCEKIRSRPVTMIQQPHPRTWNFISVFLIMKILTRPLFPHCPLWRALLSWLHTTALQLAALVWGVGHKASQWRTTVRQRTERLR